MTKRIRPEAIIIGERIKIGQVIGGMVTVTCIIYDWLNPDNPLPATLGAFVSQVLVGLAQIVIVNWLGITVPDE